MIASSVVGASLDNPFSSLESERQTTNSSFDAFDQSDNKDIARKVARDIARAMSKVMGFRQEATIADNAYNGWQWDDLDRMRLESLKRPTIVFNEIKPTINAISGIERLNRADIRFVSRPLDSSIEQDMAGDLASESYHAALEGTDGDAERSRAIKDMSITGMGWYEIHMDYETEPDGMIVLERLPWKEMIWDTNAKKENIFDSRWRARKRQIPQEEFRARWPKKVNLIDDAPASYPEMGVDKYELVTPYYSLENERANPTITDDAPKATSIEVIQYQWIEPSVVYRYADPQAQGGIRELREKEYSQLKKRLGLLGMPEPTEVVRQKRAIYKEVYTARGICLDEPTDLPRGFSLKCVTGEWDDFKKVWYGVVRPLLDPQRTMNKSMSTALTMFLTNAKGGVMYETGAFADPEMARNQWSRPDAWLEMNEGGAQKIVQRQPVNHQDAVNLFFQESKAAMTYVSGIPQDMLGVAISDATAPVMSKRVQSALSVLGWYFDNVTRARKDEARTVLEYIREFWSQGQLIRVGGQTNAKAIPLLRNSLPTAYDLMLDDSVRHNPNLKAQVWQDIQPMIPQLLKFGLGRFLLKVLEYSPLPAQLVAELQKEAQAMQNDPNAQQGKGRGKQEDPREVEARIGKMTADTQKAAAETKRIEDESGLRISEMLLEMAKSKEELRQKDDLQRHRQVSDMIKATRMFQGNKNEARGAPPQ